MTAQATQLTPHGRILKRWYVTLPTGSVVATWAETRAGARAKCRDLRRCDPVKVEPAPPVGVRFGTTVTMRIEEEE